VENNFTTGSDYDSRTHYLKHFGFLLAKAMPGDPFTGSINPKLILLKFTI